MSGSGISKELLWDIIKENRHNFVIYNTNLNKFSSEPCLGDDARVLIDDTSIDINTFMIENGIKMRKSKTKVYDMDIETAGEMFLYLNLCPRFMFEWTQLYVELFKSSSLDIIVQTLNRLLKTASLMQNKSLVDITSKILHNIAKKYSFDFKIIDELTKGVKNITHENDSSYILELGNLF